MGKDADDSRCCYLYASGVRECMRPNQKNPSVIYRGQALIFQVTLAWTAANNASDRYGASFVVGRLQWEVCRKFESTAQKSEFATFFDDLKPNIHASEKWPALRLSCIVLGCGHERSRSAQPCISCHKCDWLSCDLGRGPRQRLARPFASS